jgi:hypothetical protein
MEDRKQVRGLSVREMIFTGGPKTFEGTHEGRLMGDSQMTTPILIIFRRVSG